VAVIASETVSALHAAQTTSHAELVVAEAQLVTAEAIASETVSALSGAQVTSDAQLADAVSGNEDVANSLSESSTREARLSSQLSDSRTENTEQRLVISNLEEALLCGNDPLTIDYSSQSTVSNSLKTWLEETEGTIDRADWDVIWSNNRAALHYLCGEYLWPFVVFFDDSSGFKNRVFVIQGTCWLNE
jgi:hypothetical protein